MSVRVNVLAGKPSAIDAEVLVIPMFAGKKIEASLTPRVQSVLKRHLRRLAFKGSWGASELFIVTERGIKAPFVAVLGLGKTDQDPQRLAEGVRRGIGRVVQEARRHGVRRMAVSLLDVQQSECVPKLAGAVIDGVLLANYSFVEYSSRAQRDARTRELRQVSLLVNKDQISAVRQAIRDQQTVLSGVELARNLVNRPASAVQPSTLVDEAKRIASTDNNVTLQVFNAAQAKRRGLNAFLAVARGSQTEPYLIHLHYVPGRRSQPVPKVFLVGKGVTFDSGGLSLKSAGDMELMKTDMAGAATILGLFSVLPQLKPEVEVHGVVAACENMPGGAAYRPGDIVRAKNGTTIEVVNTDAEGRVTLADALSFAAEHKPDAIIDVATLTGACMVALGETHAGLWSNNNSLRGQLLAAARRSGEGLTSLPMPEEYRPMIESKVADVRNLATSRWGGAITAALFLREFVGEIPWAHIDTAGPSYTERQWLPYFSPGATGYGVRMLAEYLRGITGEEPSE